MGGGPAFEAGDGRPCKAMVGGYIQTDMFEGKLPGIFLVFGLSFALAWVGTFLMKRIAPRIGFVDKPGHRKIHANPKPLGGGVAIFWAIALPLLAVLAAAHWGMFPQGLEDYAGGVMRQTPMVLRLLGAAFALHLMGVMDDRKAMGPYGKLVVQLAAAAGVVWYGDFRILTVLGNGRRWC